MQALAIPAQLPGIRVEMSAHFMVVTLDSIGASLKWDGGLLVQVQASESLWNRTAGLCGNMNGDNTDDMTSKDGARPKSIVTLASSWKAQSIGGTLFIDDKSFSPLASIYKRFVSLSETCDEYPSIEHSCNARAEVADEASRFCSTLLADRRYQVCSSVMDLSVLETACRWDYCGCKHEDKKKCACDTMSVYIRQCAHKGIIKKMEWRDDATCREEFSLCIFTLTWSFFNIKFLTISYEMFRRTCLHVVRSKDSGILRCSNGNKGRR